MSTSTAHLRGMRRAVIIGALSFGAIVGGAAGSSAADPHSAPVVHVAPSDLRGLCDVSACYLVTDVPGAGIGGKT
jgi:hypothetical protein